MNQTHIAEAIGAYGVLFFSLYWSFALLKQSWNIWHRKSGASVSVPWMLYFYFLCPVYAIYGIQTDKWPLIAHGSLRGLCFIPILIGLMKYKGFQLWEKLTSPMMLLFVILMITTSFSNWIFLVASTGGVFAAGLQPWEMFRKKSIGVFDFQLALVMMLSNCFYTLYSFAVKDIQLLILCIAYFLPIGATLLLWRRYRT